MAADKPFHQRVAERIIQQLEQGTAPWQVPWETGSYGRMPMNPLSGKRYRGINAVWLWAQGRGDSRWLTYRQARELGAQVMKGERSTVVQYWQFDEARVKRDNRGREVRDRQGAVVKERVRLERPKVFHAAVFNAEQTRDMPPLVKAVHSWDPIERAQRILDTSGVPVFHAASTRAFYRVSTDSIHLPLREQFATADRYFATALHELAHATGSATRLNRDLGHPFGSYEYGKEELRAETASLMLGDELEIGQDPEQHAAYVGHWVKAIQADPHVLFRAAADASRIYDYVLGFDLALTQEIDERLQPGLMRLIEAGHAEAIEGYDPLESLRNLERVAEAHGVEAVLARDLGDGVLVVRYRTPEGEVLPMHTELCTGDGKAASHVRGERVVGTNFTSDLKWQADALSSALAAVRRAPEQVEARGTSRASGETLAGASLGALQGARAEPTVDASQVMRRKKAAGTPAEPNGETRATPAGGESELGGADARGEDFARRPMDAGSAAQTHTVEGEAQGAGSEGRVYLAVPYIQRNAAKALGARWDRQVKPWYVPAGVELEPFARWCAGIGLSATVPSVERRTAATAEQRAEGTMLQEARGGRSPSAPQARGSVAAPKQELPAGAAALAQDRTYLAVPYSDRALAKAAGARWDRAAKSWYAPQGVALEPLRTWWPSERETVASPVREPHLEFLDVLREMGGILGGGSQVRFDGRPHRMSAEGDRHREQAMFYVVHLDGAVPYGYVKNHRTGEQRRWVAKGYTLSEEEKAQLRAAAAAQHRERQQEQEAAYVRVGNRVQVQLTKLSPVEVPTPYLAAKGVEPHAGIYTDDKGRTYVPAMDTDGFVWTMQVIQASGTKRFVKGGRKSGCFHVVGGPAALENAPVLVVAEGYATAASLTELLGQPAVASFDGSNLGPVTEALHKRYPSKPVIVAGDDDLALLQNPKLARNVGRLHAERAASAVGGQVLLPVFAPGEQGAEPKRFSDFNDLATGSALGREAARRQVLGVYREAAAKVNKAEQSLARTRRNVRSFKRGFHHG